MLRQFFGQSRRRDEGGLLAANQAITEFLRRLRKLENDKRWLDKYNRLYIWAKGFVDALNELEQSKYAAEQFYQQVKKKYLEDMTQKEADQYYMHVYFYKNGFIRIFSILDKLGHFLNDFLDLRTEKVKVRFSYFTVLRQLDKFKQLEELENQLFAIKEKHQESLNTLRFQRNTEIHSMNTEMLDDLYHKQKKLNKTEIEDLQQNIFDLEQSYQMVCSSIQAVFTYCGRVIRR